MSFNSTVVGSILDNAISMNPSYNSPCDGPPLLSHLRIGTAVQSTSTFYNATIHCIKHTSPISNAEDTT